MQRIATVAIAVALVACGGGGGASGHAPTISNLVFTPAVVYAGEGGGTVQVSGSVLFSDDGGDVVSFTLTTFDSAGRTVASQTYPASGASGVKRGSAGAVVTISTSAVEHYTFELFATDSGGRTSNVLTGSFRVAPAAWRARAPMPTRRTDATAVALNGRIYLIGGSRWPTDSMDVVESYDPATDTWSTVTPLSIPRHAAVAAVIDGRIYVAQGTSGLPPATEEYDPASGAWSSKAPFPDIRHGAAAFALDGRMYVVGGTEGGTAVDTAVYDPASNAWTRGPALAPARDDLAACTIGAKGYAIGGYLYATVQPWADDVDELDPSTSSWTARAPMPVGLYRHSAVNVSAWPDQVVIVGGMTWEPQQGMFRFDPMTGSSKSLTGPPLGAGGPAVVVNERIYLPGPDATYEYIPENELNP